jgi:hypothetical protein
MELEKRFRQADDRNVLAYQIVNDTHELVPYRQAVLWQQSAQGSKRLLAVSGLATPDANAPFTLWMQAVGAELAASSDNVVQQARVLVAGAGTVVAVAIGRWPGRFVAGT